MRLSIVTVLHESSHILPGFLETLNVGDHSGVAELILVDSGSSDWDKARRSSPAIGTFLRAEANLGYGMASNLGVRYSQGDWLAFVNPDVAIRASEMLEMLDLAESSDVECVGPTVVDSQGRDQQTFRGFIGPPWRSVPEVGTRVLGEGLVQTGSVSGCCLLIRRGAFLQLGGFDPRFFMFAEEIDLQARLVRSGGTVAICTRVRAVTAGGGSSLGVARGWSHTQRAVSHVKYVRKHFGRFDALVDLVYRTGLLLLSSDYGPQPFALMHFFRELRRRPEREKDRVEVRHCIVPREGCSE